MTVAADLVALIDARRGHYRHESGYHGDLWLALDALFLRPARLEPAFRALALQLQPYAPDTVVGPLVGGAFVAQRVAALLDIEFLASERTDTGRDGLYPVDYALPAALHGSVRGKRVAIVDDAINAGSAVLGTRRTLRDADADIVVAAALLTVGDKGAAALAAERVALHAVAHLPAALWAPAQCPLCAAGRPLDRPV